MRVLEILIALLVNIIVFLVTDTKNAFLFSLIALIFIFAVNKVKQLRTYKSIHTKSLIIASFTFPIGIVLLSVFYTPDNPLLMFFNKLINGRLALGHSAFINYGVKLFGQYIELSSDSSTGVAYNIIDSSYMLCLIILGAVFFIALIIMLLYFSWLVGEKKDIYMFIVFFALLAHSMFDPQLLHISHNTFLFILSYKNSVIKNE